MVLVALDGPRLHPDGDSDIFAHLLHVCCHSTEEHARMSSLLRYLEIKGFGQGCGWAPMMDSYVTESSVPPRQIEHCRD